MKAVRLASATAALGAVLAPVAAFAQTAPASVDYSTLTDAVDIGDITAALLAVGGTLVVLALCVMGIRKVLRFIK